MHEVKNSENEEIVVAASFGLAWTPSSLINKSATKKDVENNKY